MIDVAHEEDLVSIVLPTYNRAHVLPYAIQSVLGQTYGNLELIIVDDNSSDDTRDVVSSFTDERIKYIRNESNLKLPRALNRGFEAARGAYLTWTSDDNMYVDTAIERMVEALRTRDCDFVYADYFLFSELDINGQPLEPRHDRLPAPLQLEKGNHIGACFMYTRRVYEEVGDYDPQLFLIEDYDYFIRAAKHFAFCHIPEPLYYFRRDDATLYLSRFCEVRASDVLVRYKNGLLGEHGVVDAVVALLGRYVTDLKNPLLRWTYFAARVSFRAMVMHHKMSALYLRWRLRSNVEAILEEYRSARMTFADAREALNSLMQTLGKIEYKR